MAIYVPMLKAKRGELAAIKELDPSVREQIFPVFDVPPVPWDHLNDTPAKSVDDHLKKLPENLEKSVTGIGCAIDLKWLDPSDRMSDGTHPLAWMMAQLRASGVHALPVVGTGPRYDTACIAAARAAIQSDGRGCIVRVAENRIYQANLDADLTALVSALGIAQKDAHLLIDLESIAVGSEQAVALAVPMVLGPLPSLSQWRSLTLAATAFPFDLTGIAKGLSTVPRSCWVVWYNVFIGPLARKPLFADYCVDSHDRSEPDVDPRFMKGSTNIRYAAGNEWLILKGPNWKDHGFAPMQGLCAQLIADTRYLGPTFSAGDKFIDACARGGPTSNAEAWRKAAVNHHITHAVRQLASLNAPSTAF